MAAVIGYRNLLLRLTAMVMTPWLIMGCTSPPQVRTTFLNSVDLVAMTDQMAESFVQDEVIAERTPQLEPWVISIDRIRNHTNQIIPDREKWLFVNRLRALLMQSDVSQQRNLIWIMPPERWQMIAEEMQYPDEPFGIRMNPTHLLTATFDALTVTSGRGRSDTYLAAYELVDLQTGRVQWQDKFEVKRAISGRTYD